MRFLVWLAFALAILILGGLWVSVDLVIWIKIHQALDPGNPRKISQRLSDQYEAGSCMDSFHLHGDIGVCPNLNDPPRDEIERKVRVLIIPNLEFEAASGLEILEFIRSSFGDRVLRGRSREDVL